MYKLSVLSLIWCLSLPAIPPPKDSKPVPRKEFMMEILFKIDGKAKTQLPLPVMRKKTKAKGKTLTVWEPHEKTEIQFHVLPFNLLLDQVFGKRWRNKEEVVFTCRDGYQPSIPVVEFKTRRAFLAYRREGAEKFEVKNNLQDGSQIDLSPFYLVWDNRSSPEKGVGATGWPYQITGIEVVRFDEKFPQISPGRSSSQVALGFKNFRTHCMSCHTMNGDGGTKGVELNYPMNITEYFNPKHLKKWILEPTSVRWGTTMPPLPRGLNNRDRVAEQIIAYLKRMKDRKKKPKKKS